MFQLLPGTQCSSVAWCCSGLIQWSGTCTTRNAVILDKTIPTVLRFPNTTHKPSTNTRGAVNESCAVRVSELKHTFKTLDKNNAFSTQDDYVLSCILQYVWQIHSFFLFLWLHFLSLLHLHLGICLLFPHCFVCGFLPFVSPSGSYVFLSSALCTC